MKTIKINYAGQLDDFDVKNNRWYNILKKYYHIEISANPEYCFYNNFEIEEHFKYDCVKIYWTGENLTPDFNLCDYAVGFDYIGFEDRYIRFPLWLDYWRFHHPHDNGQYRIVRKQGTRDKFCSFVVSNGKGDPMRELLFDKLAEYKKVDSGGRYRNNIGGPVTDKIEFASNYKFAIAAENVSQSGYTTEKILEAFVSGTVPIYWGDPNVINEFNPVAFINCHDFNNIEEIVNHVKMIDNDDILYNQMLNAPILNDNKYIQNKYQELEDFTRAIIETPLTKARKNSQYLWKADYNQKMKQYSKIHKVYKALKKITCNLDVIRVKIIRFIKRILGIPLKG
jgi:hypothetical protein